MSVRTSMATLIDRVNALCNNALNANLAFANQDVQDCLDRCRMEARYEPLEALATVYQGGSVGYLTFCHRKGLWEGAVAVGTVTVSSAYAGGSAGYQLIDGNYGTVTPLTSDLLTGRWTFGTAPVRPVMITGWTYDIYAAAAELLLLRKAQVSEDFDFATSEGLKYTRSQKLDMIEKVRKDFLSKATMTPGRGSGGGQFVRKDTNPC